MAQLLRHLPVFQIFVDNFVHADLHPGNILVQGTAQASLGGREQTAVVDLCDTLVVEVQPPLRRLCLVLLDAGIVAELQSADMQNFRAVFTAVVQGQVRLGKGESHGARWVKHGALCFPLQSSSGGERRLASWEAMPGTGMRCSAEARLLFLLLHTLKYVLRWARESSADVSVHFEKKHL